MPPHLPFALQPVAAV